MPSLVGAALKKVGVEAVVENLQGFMGDMSKIDDAIRKLASPTHFLEGAFQGLGNVVSGLAGGVLRTLEYTLGTLIANAVQFVAGQIRQLVSDTIAAGMEFQKLSLRLNTLNFNAATESGMDFAAAQREATSATRDQLGWLQRLAATTPYDNQDISNTYTLARGYGFVDDQARSLTETVIDFASGMGLGNVEMVRIIKNFGQMSSLGKVMQRDLNDLATGAFVPVNKILEMMREETGLTGDAFDDFRTSGEGVESFFRNFTKLVEGSFGGSAQKMARTFGAATDNVRDFVKSIVGLNIVKPILDVLGGRLADFMDVLTGPAKTGFQDLVSSAQLFGSGETLSNFDRIVAAAQRIGNVFADIISEITGIGPSAEEVVGGIVSALEDFAFWLENNKGKILEFVQGVADGFNNTLLPAISQVWGFLFGEGGETGAIQNFGAWLRDDLMPFIQSEVLPGIQDLFNLITGQDIATPSVTADPKDRGEGTDEVASPTALEKTVEIAAALASTLPAVLELFGAIGNAILVAFGGTETQTFADFIANSLIPAIQDLTQWIRDNQETVAFFVKTLAAMEILGIIVGLVLTLVVAMGSLAASFVFFFATVGIIAIVTALINGLKEGFNLLVMAFRTGLALIANAWETLKSIIIKTVPEMQAAIAGGDWLGAGRALIDGLIEGISSGWSRVISLVEDLAQAALEAFNNTFNISSPSKVMVDVGKNIIRGLTKGLIDSTGMATKAMASSANAVLSSATPRIAAPGSVSTTNNNTNNFALNISSNSSVEPIVQDFGLMQSMVSGQ